MGVDSMRAHATCYLAVCSLILASCATSPDACNPREASFFKNTSCLASGAYDTRQGRLELELAKERGLSQDFHAVLAALEAEQADTRGQLRRRQGEYASLDQAWHRLQTRLSQAYGGNRALEQQIRDINRSLSELKSQSDEADLRAKEDQRAALRQKLSLLQQEVDAGI
jgi:septal ring factor EnvC (AmiA/AmiB activator)